MLIYNTLTRKKEPLEPLRAGEVTMYICGVTPYDSPHLGHATTCIRGNLLRRYLEHKGLKVRYVQNITDIDDKIILRARKSEMHYSEITAKYIAEYQEQTARLGVQNPDHEPKATEYVPQIIKFIEQLIVNGGAYVTSQGDVYFDIDSDDHYGCLSNLCRDELLEGTREQVRGEKKNPGDFALWKRFENHEENFPSPWGNGRPGWHIECSVMCTDILGPKIDIHLGGLDLLFPHHENEAAQCRKHFNDHFVKVWVHLGLLNIDGQKMSKSLGNFMTIKDAVDKYGRALLVYVTLSFQYRSSINLSEKLFEDHLNHVLDMYRELELVELRTAEISAMSPTEVPEVLRLEEDFSKAMDDDFNTPLVLVALALAFKNLRALSSKNQLAAAKTLAETIRKLGQVVLLFTPGETFDQLLTQFLKYRSDAVGLPALTLDEVNNLFQVRTEARKAKDYAKADEVRDTVAPYGIIFQDGSDRFLRFEPITKL